MMTELHIGSPRICIPFKDSFFRLASVTPMDDSDAGEPLRRGKPLDS